jgi:signal transduction histidine kinase
MGQETHPDHPGNGIQNERVEGLKYRSIRFKIGVLYTAIIGCILFGYSAFLYMGLRVTLYEDFDAELETKVQEVVEAIRTLAENELQKNGDLTAAVQKVITFEEFPDPDELEVSERRWLRTVRSLDLRDDSITFFPASALSTSNQLASMDFRFYPLKDSELQRLQEGKIITKSYDIDRERGADLRVVSAPYITRDQSLYILQVGTSIKPIIHLLRRRLLFIMISIPALVTGAGFVGRCFVSTLMKPVEEITRTAQRITHENLDERVLPRHNDEEMHYLVDAFNEMIGRLDRSFQYIKEFSMQVAHELKTPLTIIRGESDLALKRLRSPEEYQKVVSGIQEETARMTSIINELLLFTKLEYAPEAYSLEPTDLVVLLGELYNHTKILARKRNILHQIKFVHQPLIVNGSTLHLRRLFLNLISNALKFTEAGGEVSVRAEKEGNMAAVSVADTGTGISEGDITRVFEPFFHRVPRTSRDSWRNPGESGTGLGLSIAQSIAQFHLGSIQVRSKKDEGSVFTVYIPLISDPS